MTGSSYGWRRALIALAAGVGIALTFSLGRWQLSRADQKIALQAALQARENLPPVPAAQVAGATAPEQVAPLLHREATLTGEWLPDQTVFLDNRPMAGRAGFYVLTPLRLAGSSAVVLVLRGWAPRNFQQRDALPPIATPQGPVSATGRLADRVPAAFSLGRDAGGRIRQNLALDAFRAETGLPLAHVVLQQTGPAADGLLRDWPPPATGVDKHYGYAFQWFGLCALIALLFIWFQVARPFLRSSRS
ncbi:SURF1 family protein [Ottowia oryzae]